VLPLRNAKAVKWRIVKAENIKDGGRTSLFLTPYSESPMDDADMFTIHNGNGPGSNPQEPLALVAKMSDSGRRALESDGRVRLASTSKLETMPPDIRHGTSIRHPPSTFLFITSFIGGSVLRAIR
jgi:hypothetical protein